MPINMCARYLEYLIILYCTMTTNLMMISVTNELPLIFQDKYLHTNCLAALANMSSQFRTLHPYVCQRLVSLFETLSKRHSRLCESLRASEDLLDESENDMPDAVSIIMYS